MVIALLSVLAFMPTGDPDAWTSLPPDPEGAMAYRRLPAEPDDPGLRVVLRVIPVEPREWTSMEMTFAFDCRARTTTILAVRVLDADGRELQSVTAPEDRRKAEPIYAGDDASALIYADLCPDGPPLDERPPPLPPPIPVAPSVGPSGR